MKKSGYLRRSLVTTLVYPLGIPLRRPELIAGFSLPLLVIAFVIAFILPDPIFVKLTPLIEKHTELPQFSENIFAIAMLLLALPVFLYAVSVPIRVVWHKQDTSIGEIYRETIPELFNAYLASILAALGLLFVSSILLVLAHIVRYSNAYASGLVYSNLAKAGIVAITVVIGYYILKSLLNILATPFISCNAKYSPVAAWSAAPFILSGRRMHFAALITITALLMAIVHMSFATDFRLSLISFLEPPLQFSIALYAASVISTFLLSCGETLAVKQVRNLQNLATPIKVKAGRERRNSLRAPIKRDVVVERAKRITGAKRETVAFSPKDLELIR